MLEAADEILALNDDVAHGAIVLTGVLSFGLVAIPVRIHTATKSENVSFHLLHDKCGSRVRNLKTKGITVPKRNAQGWLPRE
jgi:hypothetical protein